MPAPAVLEETALRLPAFSSESANPVVLADGQTWYLPRPSVDFFPVFIDGKATLTSATTFGPEFDEKAKAALGAANDAEYFVTAFDLGADLLRRNYAIEDRDLATLLRYRKNDPASMKWINAIIGTANGDTFEQAKPQD